MTTITEKRQYARAHLPFVLKFRPATSDPESWDAVIPVNMSESGACFLTTDQFSGGTGMYLLVINSILAEERVFDCKVARSEKFDRHSPLYQTAVTIDHVDEDARQAYKEVLNAFLSQKGEMGG